MELFACVLAMARKRQLLSEDHFSIDSTLVEAWASHKSLRRRDDDDDNGRVGRDRDYHGERLSNATHVSRTDREAELMRKSKGKETRLRYGVHHVVENRNHLIVGVTTAPAAGVDEREAAIDLLAELPGEHRKTVGGDKGYDCFGFVAGCRAMNVTPHVAMNDGRRGGSALDARTTRHAGYAASQRKHKMIENLRLGEAVRRIATADGSRPRAHGRSSDLCGDGVQLAADAEPGRRSDGMNRKIERKTVDRADTRSDFAVPTPFPRHTIENSRV